MTYRWLFDDGTDAEGKFVTHAFAEEGDHTITLIASDGELTGKKIRHLNIIHQGTDPIAVAEISKTSGPTHFPFSFKASNSYDEDPNDDVVKFHWDFGDGFTSSEADTTHSYSKDDLYDIVLTVTDRTGRTDINTEFSIHVKNREPFVILNLLGTGIVNTPIKMTATAQDPDGKITDYKWDFGDKNTLDWSNESKPDHEYDKIGTYTVIVWVQDDAGQVNMSSGVIKIEDKPPEINPDDPVEGQEAMLWLIVAIIATVIIIAIVVIVMRIRRETL
jgi:PKD repeat protein